VYSNIEQKNLSDDFLQNRMLLSAQNNNVQDINNRANNTNIYPIAYLNSLNPSGMPFSKLDLKIEYPIMLLYNLASC
ncbi:2745_t:CDS:2, partial [Gigaspora margarita]